MVILWYRAKVVRVKQCGWVDLDITFSAILSWDIPNVFFSFQRCKNCDLTVI